MRHVALRRGINAGGKNTLPMTDLAAIVAATGCRDVTSYIQSGNVLFSAPARGAASLSALIAQRIHEQFGIEVPILLRTAAELGAAAAANPFLAEGAGPDRLHVMFLADRPAAARVARLDPERSPPDRFAVRGREVYLLLPNGAARTKLTNAWFDAQLGAVSTVRNWKTVLKLAALAARE